MPAIAAIKTAGYKVSTDTFALSTVGRTIDATTGVSRTFDPDGFKQAGLARWVDRSSGISIGYPSIELSVRRPINGSKVYRVTLTISLPTLEQTSASTASGIQPAPTKAYEHFCKMEFLLPERGAAWERRAIYDLAHSMFLLTINASDDVPTDSTGNPLFAAVQNFDPPY